MWNVEHQSFQSRRSNNLSMKQKKDTNNSIIQHRIIIPAPGFQPTEQPDVIQWKGFRVYLLYQNGQQKGKDRVTLKQTIWMTSDAQSTKDKIRSKV